MIEGAPWFVAADACRALSYNLDSGTAYLIKHLAADEKIVARRRGTTFSPTPQVASILGPHDSTLSLISRPGLFKLIARSTKPEARAFDRWVRHEVLPHVESI